MEDTQRVYDFLIALEAEVSSKGINDYTKPYLDCIDYVRSWLEEVFDVE